MSKQQPLYSQETLQTLKRGNIWLYRLAKEHIELATLKSSVIKWEPVRRVSQFSIPDRYMVTYYLKSIVGIADPKALPQILHDLKNRAETAEGQSFPIGNIEALQPLYGEQHTLEIEFPPEYPQKPCKLYFKTDIWHPNIKSEGQFKGKVCGNTDGFGLTYGLYQLVLRIGEIIQYKNYHAIHTWPFPEDSLVADWVTKFAEPNNIVSLENEIYTDDKSLISLEPEADEDTQPESAPVTPPINNSSIKIKKIGKIENFPTERKLIIRPKED